MWGFLKVRDGPLVHYRFDGFHLDVRDRRLTHDKDNVRLEPKSFDVLSYLLENAGHLVSKEDLVAPIWTRAFVSDNSLTRCIHQIRAALEDDAEQPRYIETVPGTGYRFIAPVDVETEPDSAPVTQQATRHRWSITTIAAIVVALIIGIVLTNAWLTHDAEAPVVERIAVLPLTNLTGADEQEYFVQGVHEALIAELSRIASIDVISRTSVMSFRDTELAVPEIAERLNVDAIVEGSVMRAGENLTVTAQLIATNPERHLWAERYHRDVSELFEIATEIVAAIASEIAIELSPEQQAANVTPPTMNRDAYEAYLQGRFFFEQRTPYGYMQARIHFQQAIDTDPSFASPYVGLAHTFGSAAIFGAIRPEDGFPEARRLAEQAVALDDTLATAHQLLAGVLFYWDWNWDEAERKAQHVLTLNPNLANAYRFLAEVYSVTGRHDEAMTAIERGREIDPLPPTSQFKPSFILYLRRDYDEAIARAEAALEHYPNYWQGHWLLCLSFAATERYDEAVISCRQAVNFSRNTPMAAGALGYALALAGHEAEASETAADLEARSASSYVGPASIAMIYGALGRTDEAFGHLEQAYALRDQQLVHAEHAAIFDPIRSDQRFRALRDQAMRTALVHNKKITTE
jgi:TolB-like protein/DNA-binding winged helix-turn-helix (wHTH) protein/Flp pilus assembly protein TadD